MRPLQQVKAITSPLTFFELQHAKRLFSDQFAEVETLADVLDAKVKASFLEQKKKLAREEIAFKEEIQAELVKFRSGKSSKDLVGKLLDAFDDSLCSEKNVRKFLEEKIPESSTIQHSIDFYLLLRERGVRYLKRSETLQTELFRKEGSAVYVLFTDPQAATENFNRYLLQHNLFFNLIKETKEASFLVLDVSVHQKVSVHKQYADTCPCIVCYLDGVGKEVTADDIKNAKAAAKAAAETPSEDLEKGGKDVTSTDVKEAKAATELDLKKGRKKKGRKKRRDVDSD